MTNEELITVEQGCALIGGEDRPVSKATYYRGVKAGRFSAPVHPSPGISRIVRRKLLEDLARICSTSAAA
jgi:hypothetical protein